MSHQDKKSESNTKSKWEQISEREIAADANAEGELQEILKEQSASKDKEPEDAGSLSFASRQQLENQLTEMEAKAAQYKEQVLRVQAEMENLRRRTERDIASAIKYGNEKLVSDILPIVDSLVRGLDSPESQDPHVKSMRDGLSLTLELCYKTLTKHGIQLINPKPGDVFNPALHEAVSMQKVEGKKPNTILHVMQQGYQLNDRVLRAAIVTVAG